MEFLPFVDQATTYQQFDFGSRYNAIPQNITASKQGIITFVCPSDAWRPSVTDKSGYGCTDYAASFYVDIDPATGLRNKALRADGIIVGNWRRLAEITDGQSNTFLVVEDNGRDERVQAGNIYIDPVDGQPRRDWRWAEPDASAIGISMIINNNKSPAGGPPTCPWSTNNCGVFEEIFSFHTGGAHVLMGDSSTRFISENLDYKLLRSLVTLNGGEIVGEF